MRDFVSKEERGFRFKIGSILASGLSGFIAGVVFASVIWAIVLYFCKTF